MNFPPKHLSRCLSPLLVAAGEPCEREKVLNSSLGRTNRGRPQNAHGLALLIFLRDLKISKKWDAHLKKNLIEPTNPNAVTLCRVEDISKKLIYREKRFTERSRLIFLALSDDSRSHREEGRQRQRAWRRGSQPKDRRTCLLQAPNAR